MELKYGILLNKLEDAYALEISILEYFFNPKKENFYSLIRSLKNIKFLKTKYISQDNEKTIYIAYIDQEEEYPLFIMYQDQIFLFIGNLLIYIGIILNKIQLYFIDLYNRCSNLCNYLKNIIDTLEEYKQKAFKISIEINEDIDHILIHKNGYKVFCKFQDFPYYDSLIKNNLSNHSKYIKEILSILKDFQIHILFY
ncbi:MAG: hypothetical protein QW714_00175 [Nanopusillaceae archaeon]